MKDLLEAIKADLVANLGYLKWVEVLDNEQLPPDGVEFPGVGLRDGSRAFTSQPGKKDYEQANVVIVPYQSLALDDIGAAVMGDEIFKGVLDIAADVRTRLNDNLFALTPPIVYAHVDQIGGSETLANDKGSMIQMARIQTTYRRFS